MKKTLSLLKSVFIFKEIEDNLLNELAKQLEEVKFKAGDIVFKENDKADSFYIVDSGQVTISKQFGTEKEKILAVFAPGNIFGEMAFFSDSPRTATAKTNVDSKLWEIKREEFMRFISEQTKAGLTILSGLLKVAMERLEKTSRELATIYHTGNIISSGKSLSKIAEGIRDEIILAVPEADGAAIFLYNEFNEEYDPAAAPKNAGVIAPDSEIVKIIKLNPSGVVIEKYDEKNKEEFLKNCKSVLFAPILKNESLLGLMVLWNIKKENVFKDSHALLTASVGSQFAEAIENIKHQQEEKDRQRLKEKKEYF